MIHDISVLVGPGTPEWPGDAPFSCGWTTRITDGASVNLSRIGGSPHVGTHADAPLHVRDGAAASDALPLEPFLGDAVVIDVSGASPGPIVLAADDPRLRDCGRAAPSQTAGSRTTGPCSPRRWPPSSRAEG